MKVLVIADTPDIVESVSLTLSMSRPDSEIVSAPDGETALYFADKESPTLVVLDIDLPDMDGFSICKEIRRFSDVPIIILTHRDGKADIVRGLDLGADDYIIHPFRPIEFLARVKSVLRRTQVSAFGDDKKPCTYGDLMVDFSNGRVHLGGQQVQLTPIESQLLYHLAKNAGKVVPHRTLLGHIWGWEYREETSYLKVHIKNLREKLGDDFSNPQYILTERNVGYRFAKITALPLRGDATNAIADNRR